MVVQDNTAKAQKPMPDLSRMMWIGYAIHRRATHSVHFPDAPFGDMHLRTRRIGKASQLNHAATGGRRACTSPPLRLDPSSRQDAQSLILSLNVLRRLFIFTLKGACS
ncbi:MAG: hypothetical protein AAFQ07_09790 [Chloroflexota bacterium]